MANTSGKDGVRKQKTRRLLENAMCVLLERNSFEKITVRDICEEASVSRATFYAYHVDKYAFLEEWLADIIPKTSKGGASFERTELVVNGFIYQYKAVLKSILADASDETLKIVHDAILSTLNISEDERAKSNPEFIALTSFYAGGVIEYLQWLIRNKFPENVTPMNIYLYNIIKTFRAWSIAQK